VNSNPATIMTDPGMADATYIEPLTAEVMEQIIARERPDALLPNLGGQTGLNLSSELYRRAPSTSTGCASSACKPTRSCARGPHRVQEDHGAARHRDAAQRAGLQRREAEQVAADIGYPWCAAGLHHGGTAAGTATTSRSCARSRARHRGEPRRADPDRGVVIGWEELELESSATRRTG